MPPKLFEYCPKLRTAIRHGAAKETIRVLGGELPVNLRNPEAVGYYRRRFLA